METNKIEVLDEQEGTDFNLNKDELREVLKVNSNKRIDHMRISPKEASKFDTPLC
jgi:hypothetical protein